MLFAKGEPEAHKGAKVFWRKMLPRLKYHNPATPMTIERLADKSADALMTIHFTSPRSAAETPPAVSSTTTSQTSTARASESTSPPPTVRTEVIPMRGKREYWVLQQLLKITKAQPVRPTAEEQEEILQLQASRRKGEEHSKKARAIVAETRRQAAQLVKARGEMALTES